MARTLRVKLYTNRIYDDISPYLTYVYQYYLKHGVELHFDIAATNVNGYQSMSQNIAGGGSGYVIEGAASLVATTSDHDMHIFMFDLNEWKSPWYWPYPLRWDAPRSSCVLYDGKPFISLAIYSKDFEGTKITFTHELMHALAKIYKTADVMDSYYLNANPDAVGGNFDQQWQLLSPYLNTTMDLAKWDLSADLLPKAIDFLTKCKTAGYDLKITEGYRSMDRQAALYAQGRTAAGKIVTNAKPGQSKHNFRKAFDFCFNGKTPYPADDKKWKAIADIGVSCGLTMGYYFKSFQDKPHAEI